MWIVTAYYTPKYQKHANRLVESLEKFNIPNDVCLVNDLGDWYKNTQFKPVFLQQMLEKHTPKSIVYVDVDAEFLSYPSYFDELDLLDVNIAVHVLDHSKYRRKGIPSEMLSGTIFLKNTEEVRIIISAWRQECDKNSQLWDQRALAIVLKQHKYHLLPESYVVIFDYMASIQNPVIKHYQASREFRNRDIVQKR
jgi:hypothetical protein